MSDVNSTRSTPIRRGLRRILLIIGGLASLVTLVLAGGWVFALASLATAPITPISSETVSFDGRYLVAASDADMIGTAYADGVLRQIIGSVDTLSLVPLPLTNADAEVIKIPVSNAVTSWPHILAVSPEGDALYVAETSAPIPDTVELLAADMMPRGRHISYVDLSDGAERATVMPVEVGDGAIHLGLSADGAYLAVGLRERGRQLAILPTDSLDDPSTFLYFSIDTSDGQPATEVTAVSWHPSGAFLAVGIDAREVQFYRVAEGNDGLNLLPHGPRITGGYRMSYGQFTRDGQFYLTTEINWERPPGPLGNLLNPPSEMLSIRFDAGNAAQHVIAARVAVGQSAEGFAIDAEERLIVTVDMGRTYLPDALTFWPGGLVNTLSLLAFDRQTGALTPLGRYGFEGVLPEAAQFDIDGDSLAVVIYNERENPMADGYIEFWNVIRAPQATRLERTNVRLPISRGGHALTLIP